MIYIIQFNFYNIINFIIFTLILWMRKRGQRDVNSHAARNGAWRYKLGQAVGSELGTNHHTMALPPSPWLGCASLLWRTQAHVWVLSTWMSSDTDTAVRPQRLGIHTSEGTQEHLSQVGYFQQEWKHSILHSIFCQGVPKRTWKINLALGAKWSCTSGSQQLGPRMAWARESAWATALHCCCHTLHGEPDRGVTQTWSWGRKLQKNLTVSTGTKPGNLESKTKDKSSPSHR